MRHFLATAAAACLAATAAPAADLPAPPAAEPMMVDYVRVCDAFGAGYYFIPGTDTCLSVRGRVRADYVGAIGDTAFGVPAWRDASTTQFNVRGYLYMDSRTNTEFGLLRAYVETIVGVGDSIYGGGSTTDIELRNAFIQLGGFTFGRTQSFYDFPVYSTLGGYLTPLLSDVRTNLAAYTMAFGNGAAASLSIESPATRDVGIAEYGTFSAYDAAGGTKYPDIVGSLRLDQGWGAVQVMGALHDSQIDWYSASRGYDSVLGWAAGAGALGKMTVGGGQMISVNLTGTYSQGAISYAFSDATGVASFVGGNAAFGVAPFSSGAVYADAALDPVTGKTEAVTAWSLSGGVGAEFSRFVDVALQGGYADVSYGLTGGVGDFSMWSGQGYVGFSPAGPEGMDLGVAAEYRYVEPDAASDYDGLAVYFRAQRTF
ncbi:porin [Amorphus sp. 3PC139-8]